ncbi:MAG TPA: DNA repair protein RadC [Puia sp.]|nr:DNA repair protein RadC [Puia sp.]
MGVVIEMAARAKAANEVSVKAMKKTAGRGRKGMGRVKKLQWRASRKAIKDWAPEERPRERLFRLGAEHLSQAELLGILLRDGGGPGQSAVELARQVFYRHGSWGELKVTHGQLMNIPGIGEAKATVILAALELSRRKRGEVLPERHLIRDSRESVDYARRWLGNISHEGFAVMYLAQAGWVRSFEINSKGGISSTTVDIRLILGRALELRAVSLIVFHNHPSGSLRPSKSDEHLTQKLSQAARTMDIKLLDHVIIGEGGHFSFADEGLLS